MAKQPRAALVTGVAAVEADLEPASVRAREKRNIRNLYVNVCWQGVITAVITTFLPIFAVRIGASTFEMSLLTAVPALVVILLTLPAASLVSRQRQLIRVVTITLLGVWGCSIAIPFLPSVMKGGTSDYVPEAIIVISGLSAAFATISNPAWTAVLAEAVSPRRRPVVNGQRWALLSVVSAATVFVAGSYLDSASFPFGYQSLFVIAALAGLVGLYFLERIDVPSSAHGPVSRPRQSSWQSLTNVPAMFRGQPAFTRYVVSMFVYRMGLGLPAALFPIFWVDHLHTSDAWIGYRATAAQVALVVSYALWGRITTRKGYRFGLLACGIGTATYPALTGIVPSPVWLIPIALIWGFFAGGMDVSLFEALIDSIPADQRVMYAAINTAVANLTILIGPLLGIALIELIGIRPTFGVAGVCCLAGALLYQILNSRRETSPPPMPVTTG
jgi:MFS family permease